MIEGGMPSSDFMTAADLRARLAKHMPAVQRLGLTSARDTRLAAAVLETGAVSERQLADLAAKAGPDRPLQAVIEAAGLLAPEAAAEVRSLAAGVPFLRSIPRTDADALAAVSPELARRASAVPLRVSGPDEPGPRRIWVVSANPADADAHDIISKYLRAQGYEVHFLSGPPLEVVRLVGLHYGEEEGEVTGGDFDDEDISSSDDLLADAADGPAKRYFNQMLTEALSLGASDIHIEATDSGSLVVRMRVDGVLQPVQEIPARFRNAVLTVVKLSFDMRIEERRAFMDGRVSFQMPGRQKVDLRASFMPTQAGGAITIRLLDPESISLSMDSMAFSPRNRERLEAAYQAAHGAVLLTGPTGSGKTTTLYSILNEIASEQKKVVTIENPVEYRLPGTHIQQINVLDASEGGRVDRSFTASLKAALRNDPDVIMVGEIRDPETAQVAMQAALTGHMVLATLHTNEAAGVLSALVEKGVDLGVVAEAVNAVVAQRLIRRLCRHCSQEDPLTAEELAVEMAGEFTAAQAAEIHARLQPGQLRRAAETPCAQCNGTGYSGRAGIHEVLVMTPELQALVFSGQHSILVVRSEAARQGMASLRRDALEKAFQGITGFQEIRRVLGPPPAH